MIKWHINEYICKISVFYPEGGTLKYIVCDRGFILNKFQEFFFCYHGSPDETYHRKL